jgi:hypothetical protein
MMVDVCFEVGREKLMSGESCAFDAMSETSGEREYPSRARGYSFPYQTWSTSSCLMFRRIRRPCDVRAQFGGEDEGSFASIVMARP